MTRELVSGSSLGIDTNEDASAGAPTLDVASLSEIGLVDIADFAANMGLTPATREDGDLYENGVVDLIDFRVWKGAANNVSGTAATPEPTTLLLTLIAVIVCARFRARIPAFA